MPARYVSVQAVGPLMHMAAVRVTYRSGHIPGRPLESGEAVHGQDVWVRAYGSWRPGVIHIDRPTKTKIPVAYRVPSTPPGQYEVRNFARDDIRIPT